MSATIDAIVSDIRARRWGFGIDEPFPGERTGVTAKIWTRPYPSVPLVRRANDPLTAVRRVYADALAEATG